MVKSFRSFQWCFAILLFAGVVRAAAPEPNVVSGILVTADGKPVAGAQVTLFGSLTRNVVSDAAGHFRFEHVALNDTQSWVFAYRDNLIAPKTEINKTSATRHSAFAANYYKPLRLTMSEGKRAKFILKEKGTGKPIVGARVRFAYPDRRRQVLSDKDGIAIAAGLSAQQYHVNIFGDGYGRTDADISVSDDDNVATCKVEMELGGIVRGVVIDESGKPVADVRIFYTSSATGDSWTGDAPRTGKAGKFQERFAPRGVPLSIAFRKQGFAVAQRSDDGSLVLTAAKPLAELKIVMKRSADQVFAGTVTDTSGRPIAFAHVNTVPNNEGGVGTATDVKGRFRLIVGPTANSDSYYGAPYGVDSPVLHFEAKGFAPQILRFDSARKTDPSGITVKLERGHTIHGRVVDDQGKPVPRATFAVLSSTKFFADVDNPLEADDHGNFSFDSLPADARFSVTTPSGQLIPNVTLKLDSKQPLTFTVESPGEIRGRVLDAETGKPIRKFHVVLYPCRDSEPDDPNVNWSTGKWWPQGTTIEAADGRFKIDVLPNRTPAEIIVTADNYERSVVPRAVVRHPDQQTELKITLLSLKPSDYCTLRGQLVNHRGKTLAGVQLQMIVATADRSVAEVRPWEWRALENNLDDEPWIEQHSTGSTDSEGRFKFTKILPGRIVAVRYQGGDAPSNVWIASERTHAGREMSVTIRVPQPATIRGAIDRTAFADAVSVYFYTPNNAGNHFEQSVDNSNPKFEFKNVSAGPYRFLVFGKPKKVVMNGQTYYQGTLLHDEEIIVSAGDLRELYISK